MTQFVAPFLDDSICSTFLGSRMYSSVSYRERLIVSTELKCVGRLSPSFANLTLKEREQPTGSTGAQCPGSVLNISLSLAQHQNQTRFVSNIQEQYDSTWCRVQSDLETACCISPQMCLKIVPGHKMSVKNAISYLQLAHNLFVSRLKITRH